MAIEKYKALEDSLFGIKKNDEVEYDTVLKTSTFKGKVLPFDVRKEKKFFEEIPTGFSNKFNVDEIVHLTHPIELEIIGGKGFKTPGRRFKVSPYTALKVHCIMSTPIPGFSRRRKKNDFYYVLDIGNYHYRLDAFNEQYLTSTVYYWFINSKGTICQDVVGRDAKVEAYRTKVKNYFKTLDEAKAAFKKINA